MMSYVTSSGQYVDAEPLGAAVVGSAARTASGNGGSVETGSHGDVRGLVLDVTAQTGTSPTLDVSLQTSDDNTNWRTLKSYTQVTSSPNNQHLSSGGLDRYFRIAWVIGGSATPGYTFSVGVLGGELV